MSKLSSKALLAALANAGLKRGDTVMVQSSLLHIGPVEGVSTRQGLAEFYYRAFHDIIGPEGTMLVHTPFEAYGRYNEPYDAKLSPSTGGLLSEFVMGLPGAVRSPHPIVSVAGVGPMADAICGGNHYSGFGWDSPWGRMHRENIRFVCLGLGLSKGLSFLHHIEAMFGVPYQYTKIYGAPVYRDGREIAGPFTLSVRYLDFGIQYNYLEYEKYMLSARLAHEERFERGMLLQATSASQAFAGGFDCLNKNRFCFLQSPPSFRPGEIPADGATGDMKLVYHKPRSLSETVER
jgi:aminoglycoside 3-N-acetyltransferase